MIYNRGESIRFQKGYTLDGDVYEEEGQDHEMHIYVLL